MPIPETNNTRRQVQQNAEAIERLDDHNNPVFKRIWKDARVAASSGTTVVRAITTQDAPSGNVITANFFDSDGIEITTGESGEDYDISIYCNISDGSDLDEATRLLYEDDEIFVESITVDVGGTPTSRWYCVEGFQGNPNGVRRAVCTADAGSGSTIAANLKSLVDGTTNTAITVNCNISNGSALDEAVPRLEDGDTIMVARSKTGASSYSWYCLSNFQTSEDCTCGEEA